MGKSLVSCFFDSRCISEYVVSIAPFSTPACPDRSQNINALFACFHFLNFHPFFQGVSWPHCPYVWTPMPKLKTHFYEGRWGLVECVCERLKVDLFLLSNHDLWIYRRAVALVQERFACRISWLTSSVKFCAFVLNRSQIILVILSLREHRSTEHRITYAVHSCGHSTSQTADVFLASSATGLVDGVAQW